MVEKKHRQWKNVAEFFERSIVSEETALAVSNLPLFSPHLSEQERRSLLIEHLREELEIPDGWIPITCPRCEGSGIDPVSLDWCETCDGPGISWMHEEKTC